MGFLDGRRILITGMLSNRSIAYGIARCCAREGAVLAFTYQGEAVRERVAQLASEFPGALPLLPCDVSVDADIDRLFDSLSAHWDGLDGLVHSIAYAPREALAGNLLDGLTRESFRIAHDVSSYSLSALSAAARPMMAGRGAAIVTLTYLGAERSLPGYNVMGLAKASLEANVRYLAAALGPAGTRVNAVSAGPIRTLAASGIGGFGRILKLVEENAPLRRNVTTEDVGNGAAFLLSPLAAGITGEVLYVDSGFRTIAAGLPAD